ncbi:cadherin-17 [Discoglossus pictus]
MLLRKSTFMTPVKMLGLRLLVVTLFFIQIQTLVKAQEETKGTLMNMQFHVLEGNAGSSIYQFVASKPNSVTFVLGGETDGIIEIGPNDGLLRIKGLLDREKKAKHKLQVRTLNHQGAVEEGPYDITIIVEDINDNFPVFNQSQYYGEVREQFRAGKTFMTVYATDADDPDTPNAQLKYSITRQLPGGDKGILFQINNVTGAISMTTDGSLNLDASKVDQYEIHITVSDLAEFPFSTTVKATITVRENLWKAPPTVEIIENSTRVHPYNITKVTWNDPDVIYELQQRDKLLRFPFSIDQEGYISVTQPLDREERDRYVFAAFAKNYNGYFVARPVEIDVKVLDINDNPPVCPGALTKFEVQENERVGSSIGVLEATDMDEKGTANSVLNYRLLSQNPTLPLDNMFRIDPYTGNIQLFISGLSMKNVPEYTLLVEVSDEGSHTPLSTVCEILVQVIDINDQIPIFEKYDYGSVTIPEDTPLETVVMKIQATDDDEPNTGSSFIIYQITSGDPEKMFSIDTNVQNNTGYLKIAKPLDYESYQEHNLVIEATNPEPLFTGIQYNESSVTYLRVFVTDVDEKPYFNQSIYQTQFKEDIPVGTKLATIPAFDPEGDSIRFQLQNNNLNWLRINEDTGEIFSNAILDRETRSHYEVKVLASERKNPKMVSTVQFHLYLMDVNDNAPMLSKDYSKTLFCIPLSKPESIIVEATDKDSPSHRPFRFALGSRANVSRDWDITFINRTSVRLSMKHTQFEERLYSVPIIINDQGSPPMEATVQVPVNFCPCLPNNERCDIIPEQPGFQNVGLAVGILLGTLAVIALIIAAVFISINRKKKKEKKAAGSDAMSPSETANLGS